MKVTLHVTDGPEAGKVFHFKDADTFLVGRTKKAHLRFDLRADRRISRTHFLLEIRPPKCIVTDLGSKNGTYVNGERISRALLKDKDEIKVGKSRIVVNIDDEKSGNRVLCQVCGRDVTQEIGDITRGASRNLPYTCKRCQGEVERDSSNQFEQARTVIISSSAHVSPTISPPSFKKYYCLDCGADVSHRANTDGLASNIIGATYLCEECTRKNKQDDDITEELKDYELIGKLGEGGMGVVYKAIHIPTRRVCAIKMILPELINSEYASKVFEREIAVQSQVVHPNLVRVLDHGTLNNSPYFVTEYLAGGDVKNLVVWEHGGPLDPRLACRITVQVLTGLQALHDRGYIHRDLKPANYLLDRPYTEPNFLVKIADYGLAKSFENAGNSLFEYTREGIAAGSYVFIPPEQITNYKFVKPPVDVYAVGSSLYYMLTGKYSIDFPTQTDESAKTPPSSDSTRHPLQVLLEDPPIPLRERNPHIPISLASVVDKAVEKNLAKRFQTAAEFRGALEVVMEQQGWL